MLYPLFSSAGANASSYPLAPNAALVFVEPLRILPQLPIDQYITHTFKGVEKTNEAVDALHAGDCLRAVVSYTH